MGKITGINWTNHTFNPYWGCTEVGNSPACVNCYAKTWAHRLGFQIWGNGADRRVFGDHHWDEPLRWNRAAEKADQRRRVFSMSWATGRRAAQTNVST